MANPYSMNTYPSEYQQTYPQTQKGGPSTFGMAVTGAVGGGAVGYFKFRNPVSKDGTVSDLFAKEVFERNLKKNCSKETKTYFKQLREVLKKLDKAKDVEGVKKLLNKNNEIFVEKYSGISTQALMDSLTANNLSNSKVSLRETLKSIMNFEMQKTKNAIRFAWDTNSKKFVKPAEFRDEKLFNIIKSTKNHVQLKKAAKYGGITAAVLGALTMGYKKITSKN